MISPSREWESEGAFEVSPGVFRIPLPMPNDSLRAVNVYAIVDGHEVVLIDGGWSLPESLDQLSRSLGRIGLRTSDIREVLVTHFHRDHYSQAVALRRMNGTRISVGRGEEANLTRTIAAVGRGRWDFPDEARLVRSGAGQYVAQARAELESAPVEPDWEPPDTWLAPSGDVILPSRSLRVVATPGHTAGHTIFVDESAGITFSGDHVLPHITPSIGYESSPTTLPLADYMSSLAAVKALPDTKLLPAHGPVQKSIHRRTDELLAHHSQRLASALAAVRGGASSALTVARELRWTRRNRQLDELDHFAATMAVLETLAHLDVLVTQSRLQVTTEEDGTARFTSSA